MLDFLTKYSLTEIVIFLVMFAMASKAAVDFYDWCLARIKRAFIKDAEKERTIGDLEKAIDECRIQIEQLSKKEKEDQEKFEIVMDKIQMLIDSDKDTIKAWIVRQHHYFCYQIGSIDDYSLSCIERQYEHYKKEGGNSFIFDMMEDIRKLPKEKPSKQVDNQEGF